MVGFVDSPFAGVMSDFSPRIQDLLMDLEDIERVRKDLVSTIFTEHFTSVRGSLNSKPWVVART